MTVRNVKKNLAGQQDLLSGVGPYSQTRRGVAVSIDGPAKSYIELWKSYCGDAYVGTFEDGFTAVTGNVAVSLILGKAYKYVGATQVVVAKESSPDISWSELTISTNSLLVREALRRSYAEAGYTLVEGSFEAGGTLTSETSVLLQEATGKAYSGAGPFLQTVDPDADPTVGGYIDRSGNITNVINYAGIRAYTGTAEILYAYGRDNILDAAEGHFQLDVADSLSADNDGTILIDTLGRRWKRLYSGHVLATWFGARSDSGITDNSAPINAALAAAKHVALPYGGGTTYYDIKSPIYMDTQQALIGIGSGIVQIRKSSNTPGIGSNVMRGVTDSYAKDAVLILRHADNAYNNYARLSNLHLNGVGGAMGCDYNVYAPRVAHGMFEGVLGDVGTGLYGWVTHDTYMSKFDGVQMAKSYVPRAGSIGFWWDDLRDGSSGTSCQFVNCWARDGFDIGWKLRGLVYSTMSCCGADRYGSNALWAELCDMSIDTFGFEQRLGSSVGSPITLSYGRYSVGELVGFSADVAFGDYVLNVQGGSVVMHSIRHTTLTSSSGKAFRVADNASLVLTGKSGLGSGINTTPDIDATSSINDLTVNKSGSWTPVISGDTTPGTYQLSTAIGKYTRLGNQVTLQCYLQLANTITGGGAGGVRISGLPFAKAGDVTIPVGAVRLSGINFTGSCPVVSFVASGVTSTLYLPVNTSGANTAQIQVTDLSANGSISFTITYFVA